MKIPYPLRRLGYHIAKHLPDVWGFNFVYRRGQKLSELYIGVGRVFRNEEALKIVNNKNQVDIKEITKPYFDKYKNESTFIQRQVIDYYFWLVNDFLHAVDRNTMMFGLEARTPFLDKEVYDVARTLNNKAKLNNETTKPALRKAASKVIPNESFKKKKLGFPVPLREWVKEDDLYQMIKEKFSSDIAAKYFKQNKILKLLENHHKGKKDNYKKIWTIYTFLVWYDEYFVKEG
jgi:asparagine synthase (glutamine-hydrolysing)